jgi:Zn ribbon nucleic-acid-binding protein
MSTTTYRFTGPRIWRQHNGKCPECGKRTTRGRWFEKTVNPLNCVGQGSERRPKTWSEVAHDVEAAANAWVPDFTHKKRCRDE